MRANRVQVRRTPLGSQILTLQTLVKVHPALVLRPNCVPRKVGAKKGGCKYKNDILI